MKDVTRRKLAMAERARSFVLAYPLSEESQVKLVDELEERLARAEVLLVQQREGKLEQHAATARQTELKRAIHKDLLPYLVRVGERVADRPPEVAERLRLPGADLPQQAYLATTKAMLGAAQAMRKSLVAAGLVEAVLDDLALAVRRLEEAGAAAERAEGIMCALRRTWSRRSARSWMRLVCWTGRTVTGSGTSRRFSPRGNGLGRSSRSLAARGRSSGRGEWPGIQARRVPRLGLNSGVGST